MILLDEPSMGLAPQIVEEIFEIVKDLNAQGSVTFLLAEQNTNVALRYADFGYILENGRVVMEGEATALRENEDVKEFYLGVAGGGPQELPRHEDLPPPQTLAGLRINRGLRRRITMIRIIDELETRSPEERERDLIARLPA